MDGIGGIGGFSEQKTFEKPVEKTRISVPEELAQIICQCNGGRTCDRRGMLERFGKKKLVPSIAEHSHTRPTHQPDDQKAIQPSTENPSSTVLHPPPVRLRGFVFADCSHLSGRIYGPRKLPIGSLSILYSYTPSLNPPAIRL